MPRERKTSTNKTEMTAEELPLQARLRLEHAGKWVAWSEDGLRVVAATDEFETLKDAARRAGYDRFIWEWLPPLDEARSYGAL